MEEQGLAEPQNFLYISFLLKHRFKGEKKINREHKVKIKERYYACLSEQESLSFFFFLIFFLFTFTTSNNLRLTVIMQTKKLIKNKKQIITNNYRVGQAV
jgi:hypothetical protein